MHRSWFSFTVTATEAADLLQKLVIDSSPETVPKPSDKVIFLIILDWFHFQPSKNSVFPDTSVEE